MKKGLPAFLSVFLFLIVEIINISTDFSVQQRDNFELISNILLILIAVIGLFVIGLPSKQNKVNNLECILSNVMVSAVAFPMNIDVFKHTIQLKQLLSDLWGWHLWWIIIALVQISVLTTLGENLLRQVQKALIWGKNIVKIIGNLILRLLEFLEETNKGPLFIMISGLILWIGFLYVQLQGSDMREVLTDIGFLWNNIIFWLAFLIMGVLIYISPVLLKNAWNAVQQKRKVAWIILTVAVAAIIVPFIFPALWEIVKILITMMAIPVTVYAMFKNRLKSRCLQKENRNEGQECQNEDQNGNKELRSSDIYIVISAFIIPLIFIFMLGAFSPDGLRLFNDSDLSGITTILDFLGVVADTANNILQLLGLK